MIALLELEILAMSGWWDRYMLLGIVSNQCEKDNALEDDTLFIMVRDK